jgi:hypothetical protein
MTNDGTVDFTRYSDADLQGAALVIDPQRYPANCARLVQELGRRLESSHAACDVSAANGAAGAPRRLRDLTPSDKMRVLLPVVIRVTIVFVLSSVVTTTLALGIEYIWLIVAGLERSPVPDPKAIYLYAKVVLVVVFFVPSVYVGLSWLTRVNLRGYSLRIHRRS